MQGIFRYGCNHCGSFGRHLSHATHKNPHLCDKCHEVNREIASQNCYPVLRSLIDEVEKAKRERCMKKRASAGNEEVDVKREKLDAEANQRKADYSKVVCQSKSSDTDTINGEAN